jgi:galactonate dehydratase
MAAEAAADLVARGYTAVKFDPAGPYTIRGGHMPAMHDIAASVTFCARIREAVGDRADLLFGTHGQFSVPGAIRMGAGDRALPAPLVRGARPPRQPGRAGRGRPRGPRPRGGGRAPDDPRRVRRRPQGGGARILQPALGRAGGLWEARKIAALAESFGAEVAPHLYAGPVEWAANIHLAAAIPNLLMVETIETPFHDALIRGCIRVEDGHVPVPQAPGLGIEVDEALARAHPFAGDAPASRDAGGAQRLRHAQPLRRRRAAE